MKTRDWLKFAHAATVMPRTVIFARPLGVPKNKSLFQWVIEHMIGSVEPDHRWDFAA
jgi:hypothetical protein